MSSECSEGEGRHRAENSKGRRRLVAKEVGTRRTRLTQSSWHWQEKKLGTPAVRKRGGKAEVVSCLPSQPVLSSEHLGNILHSCLETWNQTAEGTWKGTDPASHLTSLGLLHVPNYSRGWGE